MTVLKTYNRRVVQVKIEDLNRNVSDNGLQAFAEEEQAESEESESR